MLTVSGEMKESFRIIFTSSNDCFFYLSERKLRLVLKGRDKYDYAIKVDFGKNYSQTMYSSLNAQPKPDIDDDSIGINAQYARLFGLQENDLVVISNCHIISLKTVFVRPAGYQHMSLIRKYSSFIENNLLNQIHIISVDQIIPVCIFSNVTIMLQVERLEPYMPYGKLEKYTEIVVLEAHDANDSFFQNGCHKPIYDCNLEDGNVCQSNANNIWDWFFQIFDSNSHSGYLNNLLIKCLMKLSGQSEKMKCDSVLDKLLEPKNHLIEAFENRKPKLIYTVRPLFCLNDEIQKEIGEADVVAENFFSGISLCVSPCSVRKFCKITKIEENAGNSKTEDEKQRGMNNYLKAFVVCYSSTTSKLSNNLYCAGHIFKALGLKIGSSVTIEEVDVNSREDAEITENVEEKENPDFIFTEEIKCIYNSVKDAIMNIVMHHEAFSTLITGKSGAGKTVVLNLIKTFCKAHFIAYSQIDCKAWRRLKMSYIKKFLGERLSELSECKPSILFIDDLDALAFDNEHDNGYNGMYSERFASLVLNCLTRYQKVHGFGIVATATSISKLENFSTGHGPIMFENVHEIGELDFHDRNMVLTKLINKRVPSEDSGYLTFISGVALKTKGYSFQDLCALVEVAAVKCLIRTDPNAEGGPPELRQNDFEAALCEKIPPFLNDVDVNRESLVGWDKVGGMKDVKKILVETFAWPFLYPHLFQSCPLRHQTGVLLYGAPGTGKTLIAGAVAKKCGLNFISVKGPEVLSKYVGASEECIRNLFARARKAQPCILFFDEFDSIAPKRGSQSGRVSATVVNQLLTELDGVEELRGVFVLAATSRPNLLDPALLRPGRLDKAVYCAIPKEDDRVSILRALAKGSKYSHDVSFREIAEKTGGYTGADLQALLYAAQTIAIKEVKCTKSGAMLIAQRHLLAAVSETKSSTSKEEMLKFEKMYSSFMNLGPTETNDGILAEQRTMLR